jgi:hypothetical protein
MAEARELTTADQARELARQEGTQSANLLAQIVAASSDPTVDAAKMETLANLALKLRDDEQRQQFNRDMHSAIMAMPVISKDGRIEIRKDGRVTQSTPFARFEDIDRIVRPIAASFNLTYTFEIGGDDKRVTVRPVIRHRNGFVERGEAIPLPLDISGSKQPVQGVGSSSSYGKRYALCAAFSIVAEGVDTDGYGHDQVVSLPHEREQLVLQQAEAAAAKGEYQAHFDAQSPRDRAWLVQAGHHARLGGAALPPPKPVPQSGQASAPPPPEQRRDDPPPQQRSGQREKRTPEQLTDAYIGEVRKCRDRRELEALQHESARFLSRMEAEFPALWTRIQDATDEQRDSFA